MKIRVTEKHVQDALKFLDIKGYSSPKSCPFALAFSEKTGNSCSALLNDIWREGVEIGVEGKTTYILGSDAFLEAERFDSQSVFACGDYEYKDYEHEEEI